MDNLKITIIGILLFALATCILYIWGLKKSVKQSETLKEMLFNKGASKVLNYLKKNETISRKQIQTLVSNIKASEFYSKKTVAVQNEVEFTSALIDFMLDKNLIIKDKGLYKKSK